MPEKRTIRENNAGDPIRITQAEWEVMRILWKAAKPMAATEVMEALKPNSSWQPKTIRTFLNRLVTKKAIRAVKMGPPGQGLLHYEPLVDEATTLRTERETFLGRFFGGTVRSMLTRCIEADEISTEELQELRELIDRQMAAEAKADPATKEGRKS